MIINWNNVKVTNASPNVPDFDLSFELSEGWDSAPNPDAPRWDEINGEDGDIFLDDTGDFVYNDGDESDWIDPSDDDLDAIEGGGD